ncbi:MAG: histidinol dehydrogenase, partial [Kurthia sp.]
MKIQLLTKEISLKRPLEKGNEQQLQTVRSIIETVRRDGDEALFSYTEKFDQVKLNQLRVTEEEFEVAMNEVDEQTIADLTEAANNIRFYHEKQKREGFKLNLQD